MSQSRFSIVLVGVSALLRRPLVSRLRPADGERSSWVVFAARVGRFESGFRSADWPSGSLLPLFGMHRFGVAAGRVGSSAFRFGVAVRRVGLRAHCFRFSACTASEIALGGLVLPLGGLAFGLTTSAFRHAPIRSGRWAGWPSGSLLPLFGMHRFGVAAGRVGLRAHCFRFSARTALELPSAGWFFRWASWPSGSRLPLFGTHRFGVAARRVGLRTYRFRFSACAASGLPSAS